MKPTLRILSHHHIFYYLAKINICFRWKIDNVSLLTLSILDEYLEMNYTINPAYNESTAKFNFTQGYLDRLFFANLIILHTPKSFFIFFIIR